MSGAPNTIPVDAVQPENGQQSLDPMAFGAEVRQLRKVRRLTLSDLATASGLSVSHLSAIERAAGNPSLSAVGRIAAGLAVPLAWFFSHRPGQGLLERAYVVRKGNRRPLSQLYASAPTGDTAHGADTTDGAGYVDYLLSSSIGGAFHMGITDYAPYSDIFIDEVFERDGEQHGFVLSGVLELSLGEEIISLTAGDSFSYPADIPHRIRNISDAPAQLIWVNASVILPSQAATRSSRTLPTTDHKDRNLKTKQGKTP